MAQLFINVIGLNASGKTHVAEKLTAKFQLNRISGDDFRLFIYNHIHYFKDVNNSYPTQKNKKLRPLIIEYRLKLLWILLESKQNVIFDGSGATKKERAVYLQKIKTDYPKVKTVIIWANVEEKELLNRLNERDGISNARWVDMYNDYRKHIFESPSDNEADILLQYNQDNYDEVEEKIGEFLK